MVSPVACNTPGKVFSRITKHETRITAFPVARLVPVGTEALQSCFSRSGLLGNSSRRRRGTVPCGSRITASQDFTSRKPLILRSLRNENHETRVTAFMFFTNHESRNTNQGLCVFHESRMSNRCLWVLKPFSLFFRPVLRSMKIMVREMSLIRGLGAPAKEMSFPHHLALFKDLSCPLLPTIARHCPLLPAKKMSQALVASQYGRRSRGPGRVPRAAPRQSGCTVEPTNHEPRSFLARGASRREFRGLHETRVTKHESRPFFSVGAPGWRHRQPPSGPLRPPASHCFPVHRCSPLFTIVRHCSPKNIVRS